MQSIFLSNPADLTAVNFHGSYYTYYKQDNTWYVEGSAYNKVDPTKYIRFQNTKTKQEFVATFNDYEKILKWEKVQLLVEINISRIEEKIKTLTSTLSEEGLIAASTTINSLNNLINEYKEVLNQNDVDSLIWPNDSEGVIL